MSIFTVPSFCVVTGASRGIGRSIAEQLSSRFAQGSKIVLVARTQQGLLDTKTQVETAAKNCTVVCVVANLSNPEEIAYACKCIITSARSGNFEHAILIHNAGSLADVSKKLMYTDDCTEMTKFWTLNISSVVSLTSAFLRHFSGNKDVRKTIVQISSRASELPSPGFGLYGSAKAARLQLFRVLAVEEPEVRVLSYAPGPVNTEMWNVALNDNHSSEMRTVFQNMVDGGMVREPEVTVRYLIQHLEADQFASGDHIKMPDEAKK